MYTDEYIAHGLFDIRLSGFFYQSMCQSLRQGQSQLMLHKRRHLVSYHSTASNSERDADEPAVGPMAVENGIEGLPVAQEFFECKAIVLIRFLESGFLSRL